MRGELVSNMDVPVTLANAAGARTPYCVDGRSLLDLPGVGPSRDAGPWRTDLMCESYGHHGEQIVARTVVTDQHKYSAYRYEDAENQEYELYDLQNDPYEMHNLAEQAAHANTLADMRSRLATWKRSTNDTAPVD